LFHVAGGNRGNKNDLRVSLAYYPLVAAPLVEEVVCTFMLVYPMAFFPVNRHEKWGFGGGPAGFFVDHTNGLILREAIGQGRFEFIKVTIERSPEIMASLDEFAEESDLTAAELEDSWTEFLVSNDVSLSEADAPTANWWGGRVATAKSCIRAFSWAINYAENPPNIEDFNLTL
jgi:hypothetical protein